MFAVYQNPSDVVTLMHKGDHCAHVHAYPSLTVAVVARLNEALAPVEHTAVCAQCLEEFRNEVPKTLMMDVVLMATEDQTKLLQEAEEFLNGTAAYADEQEEITERMIQVGKQIEDMQEEIKNVVSTVSPVNEKAQLGNIEKVDHILGHILEESKEMNAEDVKGKKDLISDILKTLSDINVIFGNLFNIALNEESEKVVISDDQDLANFQKRCENFDWYYMYSDDGRVQANGEEGLKKLEEEAVTMLEKINIFNSCSPDTFRKLPLPAGTAKV